jgi:hypothetical protein
MEKREMIRGHFKDEKSGRRILRKCRWIKQRDNHSCVPVAILNVLKWAGFPVTYRSAFDYWKEMVKHTAENGTHIRDYSFIFSRMPEVKMKRKTRPSLAEIDSVLSEGNAVLLRSAWKAGDEVHRHLLLITARTQKSWFLTNTFRGHAWFPKQVVETLYMEKHRLRSGIYPTAWFIYSMNPE